MTQLPVRHLSIRVPWHDNYWDGTVCTNPQNNGSCLVLKNVQSKNVALEETIKGKRFDQLQQNQLPPCLSERVSFMSSEQIVRLVNHPYSKSHSDYSHYKETKQILPPYSYAAVPFRWMMKESKTNESWTVEEYKTNYRTDKEPDLGFDTCWVQYHKNQKELLDTFFSAIKPKKSLCFIYAKHVPLSDTCDRALIGVGYVTNVRSIEEYDYSKKIEGKQSYIWERVVDHSIRGSWEDGYSDGILLPYHELLKLQKDGSSLDLSEFVAEAPSRDEYSYGAEHVSHGLAIDSLLVLSAALRKMEAPLKRSFDAEYKWIDARLSELWNMRGAFPGLGPVLTAFGLAEGNFIAWEIAAKIERENEDPLLVNPWDLVEQMFKDPSSVLTTDLARKIGGTERSSWKYLDEVDKQYIKLLSRIELNNEQADALFDNDTRSKSGYIDVSTEELLANPYLICEISAGSTIPVSFNAVDKALSPPANILTAFPLSDPTTVDGPLDQRRVRAASLYILDNAAKVDGNSLLPDYLLMDQLNNLPLDPPISLKKHILKAVDGFMAEKIRIEAATEELPKFYKLIRLAKIRDVIQEFVQERHQDDQFSIQKDWPTLVEDALGPIPDNWPIAAKEKENRARQEKAACLQHLATSKISVLIGPAGTGKTTLLNILCDLPEIQDGVVLKLAPTGKARVKMGAGAKTVAQFLNEYKRYDADTGACYLRDGNYYSGHKNVIIDESSMLTEEHLGALIDTFKCAGLERLILVGDPRQLPPIGTGRPFVDIITFLSPANLAFPATGLGYGELSVICRQKEIFKISDQERIDIRLAKRYGGQISNDDNDIDVFDEITADATWPELRIVQWNDAYDLQNKLDDVLSEELELRPEKMIEDFNKSLGGSTFEKCPQGFPIRSFFNKGAADKIESWQILSPVRGYGYGVREINHSIQRTYRTQVIELACDYQAKRVPKPRGNENVVYGDKVINNRNTTWKSWDEVFPEEDALRYIANGEIGLIIGKYRKQFDKWKGELPTEVVFSSQKSHVYKFKKHHFKEEAESPLELAYAITVHKSQGSGFETVFLILPNPCHLLSRELLYTALTRQEARVIILHQGEFKEFKKYTSGEFSVTARRITDLFGPPSVRKLGERYYDNKHIHLSINDEWMISKSEVLIANLLSNNEIPYVYEQRLFHPDGTSRLPDFVINKYKGVDYFWEHFGMMNDEDYREKAYKKIEWYKSMGVVPVKDRDKKSKQVLIMTRDMANGGIDTLEIDKIIKKEIK